MFYTNTKRSFTSRNGQLPYLSVVASISWLCTHSIKHVPIKVHDCHKYISDTIPRKRILYELTDEYAVFLNRQYDRRNQK